MISLSALSISAVSDFSVAKLMSVSTANLFDDPRKLMTRYPRQVDREYLSCRSGGLDTIQMIDGGTLYLHQDLVTCDRRRRYIVKHQLPTIFQQSDSVVESISLFVARQRQG